MKLRKYIKEANETEFDRSMQTLANIVGKGGKYAHKAFSDYLSKTFGFKPKKEDVNVRQILDDLEDWNYHTENAVFDAIVNGRKKEADVLVDIAKAHKKIGHMPPDLSTLRYFISIGTKKFLGYWEEVGKDMYGDMKLKPETIKIAKKLSKKDADTFLGLFGE